MKSLLFTVLLPLFALAQSPSVTNYQGRLTDSSGNALPDGTGYEIETRIWSASTGGTLIWGARYAGISVKSGIFNLILGAPGGTSIGGLQTTDLAQAFAAPTRYLGITLTRNAQGIATGSGEILPRQQFLAAPFSLMANTSGLVLPSGVDSAAIKDGEVATADLKDAAVTTAKIVDAAVTSTKMAAGSVGTSAIQDRTITAAKIAAGSLTPDLLSPDFAVVTFQRPSGTGPGVVAVKGWQIRPLNTIEYSAGTSISLANNSIQLMPGSYFIGAEITYANNFGAVQNGKTGTRGVNSRHRVGTRLVGQSTILLPSVLRSEAQLSADLASYTISGVLTIQGVITVQGTAKAIELVHYIDDGDPSEADGQPLSYGTFGTPASIPGVDEVYTKMVIQRIK